MRAMQAAWRNPVYFPNLVVVHWKVKGTALPLTPALWACNLELLGKMENGKCEACACWYLQASCVYIGGGFQNAPLSSVPCICLVCTSVL